MALIPTLPADLLLCVFVHGLAFSLGDYHTIGANIQARRFKGDDSTFLDFPSRLAHNLQETIQNVTVESIVFPAYEVRSSLVE
jgi:hypothetical protein